MERISRERIEPLNELRVALPAVAGMTAAVIFGMLWSVVPLAAPRGPELD